MHHAIRSCGATVAAALYEAVNDYRSGRIPRTSYVAECVLKHGARATTPSAPFNVASQHFIDGAATPPFLRRGVHSANSFTAVPGKIGGHRPPLQLFRRLL